MLTAAGFEICGVYGTTGMRKLRENDEKMYFCARCKKPQSK